MTSDTEKQVEPLLPCPFCGGIAAPVKTIEGAGCCVRCGAESDEWNRRVSDVEQAVKAEREACARIAAGCPKRVNPTTDHLFWEGIDVASEWIALVIRARGEGA